VTNTTCGSPPERALERVVQRAGLAAGDRVVMRLRRAGVLRRRGIALGRTRLGALALPRDRRDEPVAAPVHRLDEARRARIVAEQLADLADRDREHRVADRRLRPHVREQVGLGDELLRPLCEVVQHRQDLGRHRDRLVAAPQAAVRWIDAEVAEGKDRARRHEPYRWTGSAALGQALGERLGGAQDERDEASASRWRGERHRQATRRDEEARSSDVPYWQLPSRRVVRARIASTSSAGTSLGSRRSSSASALSRARRTASS
jgi:hypothetical protein